MITNMAFLPLVLIPKILLLILVLKILLLLYNTSICLKVKLDLCALPKHSSA